MTDPNKTLPDLMSRFWVLDGAHRFSTAQATLYFYLLHEFSQSSEQRLARHSLVVATRLGMTEKALATARAVLVRRGLLRYEPGTKARSGIWQLSRPLTAAPSVEEPAAVLMTAQRGGSR